MTLLEQIHKKTIELLDEQIREQKAKAEKAEIERDLYKKAAEGLRLPQVPTSFSGASS